MAKHRDRLRVVILGAGVSASCGIPVAKDILRDSIVALAEKDPESAREVQNLLHYLYPDFRKSYRNYPNVEDFLNLLDMAQQFNSFIESTLWPRPRLQNVKTIALSAITDFIWSFFVNPQPSWQHLESFFANHVPLGDVIITFNWDLTVERALAHRRPSPAVARQFSRENYKTHVTLLKPHGSIDWFQNKALHDAGIAPGTQLDNGLALVDFPLLLLSHDLIKETPIIVPPVPEKQFSDHPVLEQTWTSVYRALSSATVLTILGYSLPREDQFTRFVFRRALRNNIRQAQRNHMHPLHVIVVNPDEATEGTFARLVGRDAVKFEFHRAYFQDFVDSLPAV